MSHLEEVDGGRRLITYVTKTRIAIIYRDKEEKQEEEELSINSVVLRRKTLLGREIANAANNSGTNHAVLVAAALVPRYRSHEVKLADSASDYVIKCGGVQSGPVHVQRGRCCSPVS